MDEVELIRKCCDLNRMQEALRQIERQPTPGFSMYSHCKLQSAQVIRHKPGKRCLIQYRGLSTQGSVVELLGKVRFKGLDQRSASIQRYLFENGFDHQQAVCVPVVLGELPDWNMWLQAFVSEAAPLTYGSPEFVSAQPRVAAALRKLHASPSVTTRRHTLQCEMELLENRFDNMLDRAPHTSSCVAAVRDAALAIAAQIDCGGPSRLIHRDFYFDQVLLSAQRMWLIDFDCCCVGPPELDVGNYVAHLRELAIRNPIFAEPCRVAEQSFLEAYYGELVTAYHSQVQLWSGLSLARHVALSTLIPGRQHTTAMLCEHVLSLASNCI